MENPKGILQQSPGLRAASYPGKRRPLMPFNLEEVAPVLIGLINKADRDCGIGVVRVGGATPSELGRTGAYCPG